MGARLTHLGVVTPGKAKDHLMGVCNPSRLDDAGGIAAAHPGYVFGDRAAEELDILRQVTNVACELLTVSREHIGAVETDMAGRRRRDSDNQPGQGGFPGS